MERFANDAIDTLNGAIDNVTTSVVVNDASEFPTQGDFRVLIDSEIMLVTAVSGTTLTVTRGQEGTTAAAHSNGASVALVLTAGALDAYREDAIGGGAFASQPTAGTQGRIYLANESESLGYDTGSEWLGFGCLYKLTPLSDSGFSWVNQGSATMTFSDGLAYLTGVKADSTFQWRGRAKSAPATPHTVTMGFTCARVADSSTLADGGVAFRDSSTGKLLLLRTSTSGGKVYYRVSRFDSPSSLNSHSYSDDGHAHLGGPLLWLRIADDGTNFTFSVSGDGFNFVDLLTESRTAYLTTPDEIGFYVASYNTQADPILTIFSWVEE